jgi:hypothetical protein
VADDRLRILIEAVDKASAALRSVTTAVSGLAAAYISFQAAQRVIAETIDQLAQAAEAASEQEQADIKLASALRSVGVTSKDASQALIAQASALQRTTLYTDDQVEAAQALLISLGRLTGDGLEKATQASLDLAAGLGIDLESAAQMVAKAAQGSAVAFGRLGLKFDEGASKGEVFAKVIEFIGTNFGGRAAAAADSFAGRIDQVKKQFGELQESIGKHIITNPEFKALLEATASALAKLGEAVAGQDFQQTLGTIVVGIAQLGVATARLFEVLTSGAQLMGKNPYTAILQEFMAPGSLQIVGGITKTREALEGILDTVQKAHREASLGPLLGPEKPPDPVPFQKVTEEVKEWENMMAGGNWVRGLDESERLIEMMNISTPAATAEIIRMRDAWALISSTASEMVPAVAEITEKQRLAVEYAADFGTELARAAITGEINLGRMMKHFIADLLVAYVRIFLLKTLLGFATGGATSAFGSGFGAAGGGTFGVDVPAAGIGGGGIALSGSGIPTTVGLSASAPVSAMGVNVYTLGNSQQFIGGLVDAMTKYARTNGVQIGVEVVGG